MALFRSRRSVPVAPDGFRIEKTDHGWRVYHHGNDPATRYLSPDPQTLARLKAQAERDYERRKKQAGAA